MAQKYVVVERKNPLKPQEPAKFYAMARSNRRVDTDEVISRVSERSSYSIGELKGCITEFLLEMKNQLSLGNIVLLGDMGSFRVTIVTGNASETAENSRRPPVSKFPVSVFIREACFWTCVRQEIYTSKER